MILFFFYLSSAFIPDDSIWQEALTSAVTKIEQGTPYAFEYHRYADGPLSQQFPETHGKTALKLNQQGQLSHAVIHGDGEDRVVIRDQRVFVVNHQNRFVRTAPFYRNGAELFDDMLLAPQALLPEIKGALEHGSFLGTEVIDDNVCFKIGYRGEALEFTLFVSKDQKFLRRIVAGSERFGPNKIYLSMKKAKNSAWASFALPSDYDVEEYSGDYPSIGEPAPPFEFQTFAGENIRLEDLKGKIVLLDFWATWCRPCLKSMPHLQKLKEQYGDQLIILGLNHQEQGNAKSFIKRNRYTYRFGNGDAAAKQYKVRGLPFVFVIDQNGILREFYNGYYGKASDERLDQMIEKLMKE